MIKNNLMLVSKMLKKQKCEIICEEEGGNLSIYEENTMNDV